MKKWIWPTVVVYLVGKFLAWRLGTSDTIFANVLGYGMAIFSFIYLICFIKAFITWWKETSKSKKPPVDKQL